MHVILETDSIIQPVTGIGRYALELLRAYQTCSRVANLRCMDRGIWKDPVAILENARVEDSRLSPPPSPQRWHQNPAKSVVRRLLPRVQSYLLNRHASTHLYHSPNYRLMPFKGKSVVTFHDLSIIRYPHYHPKERLDQLTPALDNSVMNASHIITDTETVRLEVMSHYGLAADRVTAIHLASSFDPASVDMAARNSYLSSIGLSPGGYLLFTSTLEPRKNVLGLLQAYKNLPTIIRKHFPLVLAGQLGWNSEAIATELSKRSKEGKILQTGYLSNSNLSYLYSGARCFIFPSYYEGFGLPPLEAQGFGIPVITSNCSCLPEITGNAAILVDPYDVDRIGASMVNIVEDHKLHAELQKRGLENAQKFSWPTTASETLDVYDRVMNS